MNISEKVAVIRAFVLAVRREQGIVQLPGPQPELSCFIHGEFYNILWRELLFTPENEWRLDDPETAEGVYQEVLKERRAT